MGLIPFGTITKKHGISGEVKLKPFSREFENISRLKRIFIQKNPSENPYDLKIKHRKFDKNSAILKLEGIESADAAEELKGSLVMVEQSDLPETEEDEYYWFQLIGLRVYTIEGDYIGDIENLMDRTAQDLLVVRSGEKEILIPMIDTIVKEIDIEAKRITIYPTEGLID